MSDVEAHAVLHIVDSKTILISGARYNVMVVRPWNGQ